MRTDDVLHRQTEINEVAPRAYIHMFQCVEQGGSVIPGHVLALVDDVVAVQR